MDFSSLKQSRELFSSLVQTGDADAILGHIRALKDPQATEGLSRAKLTKTMRVLLDALSSIPGTLQTQLDVIQELIDWALSENRLYLKLYLEMRLMSVFLDTSRLHEALERISVLMKELRKMDDKHLIVEMFLLESRAHHALKNTPKAKAALTSGRALSNAIFCPPAMQAALDMQSGILHAEERDFKTAYSYFYEAFDALSSLDDPRAAVALKYLLLSKIMLGKAEEIDMVLGWKTAAKWSRSRAIGAMRAVGKASSERSLGDFEAALQEYDTELTRDTMVQSHLRELYENLLQANLLKLLEPYSHVQLGFLSSELGLSVDVVQMKLCQMILDKAVFGMIDQGSDSLLVFDEPAADSSLAAIIDNIKRMESVVDGLYKKASVLV